MTTSTEDSLLEGVVSSVIFHNEENGYTIARLEVNSEEIVVVGSIPAITQGEYLSVQGKWVRHATYGEQFKAEMVQRRLPEGLKAIHRYLGSGAIKGIGRSTARLMIEAFGEEALSVLENDPERLATLKGMSPKRAQKISDSFRSQMGMRRLSEFLSTHELPPELAVTLYRAYGAAALDAVKSNPYLLTDSEFEVEFSLADKLAFSLDILQEDPRRLEAGLLFELSHNLKNGHTFLPRNKLLAASASLLDVSGELLEVQLDALLARGGVQQERILGEEAVYLPALYDAEHFVSARVIEMSQAQLLPPTHMDKLLAQIESQQGMRYAQQQRQAVELAAQRQIVLITGGPGTGKTTCLRGVLALFEAMGLDTALCAPTGRAAKRLGELCNCEASTIHRLLETGIDLHSGQLVFARNEANPLKADAVIVDETSMVDISLMRALLCALKGDCRLVLVGDPDQLPSVGAGNLFGDLIRSKVVPTVRLSEIFRQAAESAIVRNAHMINSGQCPDLMCREGDFFMLVRRSGERTVETIADLCNRRLPERMGIPSDQIQVLSPTRQRMTGTRSLNQALQSALNPPEKGKNERRFGNWLFRVGDRVMQVKNNYDIMWQEIAGGESGMGMFNGDIGIIRSIEGEITTVDFDGKLVEYLPEMLGELEPAYAVTVHKAQGSEYRAVILAALDGAPMLMTRGVLYTAITRAKELLIIVGDENTVAAMVQNNRQDKRYCGLCARLREAGEQQEF